MPPHSRGLQLLSSGASKLTLPAAVRSSSSFCKGCHCTFFSSPSQGQQTSSRVPPPQHRRSTLGLSLPVLPNSTATRRSLSISASRPKKHEHRKQTKSQPDEHVPDNKAQINREREIDPYDYTTLRSAIDIAIDRFKDALHKTRNGGRVSLDQIEALPVEFKVGPGTTQGGSPPAGGAPKERLRLGDVATVVARGGRSVQVIAQEEGHVKALTAAIQGSPYSLTPDTNSPDGSASSNPLAITVPIPPATAETRQQAVQQAKKSLERALNDVKNARGDAHKQFQEWEKKKMVIVDELRKAHKGMEEVVKKGEGEVKKVFDGAVRALER